ncbi:MAG: type II toxin-antitoxin system prevent-host-death family antitoxin [Symploca sp. SIO1B1]|nr:type II toxin-antitoxin system prevent-host-death family antitoxin [Symploca sp. SIO1B1]
MQHYTLTDARNRQSEVFNKATTEPVLLTNQSLPSHVLMSVDRKKNKDTSPRIYPWKKQRFYHYSKPLALDMGSI